MSDEPSSAQPSQRAHAGRTFRVFVSSTFGDLVAERNALSQWVFPKLRALCEESGYKFQAVDLRWGVRDEAAVDQQTVRICLDEIARCQKLSPKPNFIVLLGDRYGWCPPPSVIPVEEMDALRPHLQAAGFSELVERWYLRDDNAVPAEYVLQPRRGEFEDYEKAWKSVERRLHEALADAAEHAGLGPKPRQKYHASATELEIMKGAVDVQDAREHVFGFYREITNLDEVKAALPAAAAKDLIDNVPGESPHDERWDGVAWEAQRHLKELLRDRIGDENVWSYRATWTAGALDLYDALREPSEGAAPPLLEGPPSATTSLCEAVLQQLSRVIMAQMKALDSESGDKLDIEKRAHADFARERAGVFVGREEPLAAIAAYVKGGPARPLVVHGESGSGKTMLMVQAIADARAAHPEALIVERFIGATGVSEARPLLESVCKELKRALRGESEVPAAYDKLVNDFPARLALARSDKPAFLFLDALDQLGDSNDGRDLGWLPRTLPPNVRVVVSTLPEDQYQCFPRLKDTAQPEDLVQLERMSAEEGEQVLDAWLAGLPAPRTLTGEQRAAVLAGFQPKGLPLYLKLAFEEARRWHSYDGVPEGVLASDVPGLIRGLFARLSRPEQHGKLVVSRALGFLAAARYGLSDDEMLALLWRDKDVKDDFDRSKHHELPEGDAALPPVVWSRLYFDLEPYLAHREVFGLRLLGFYHRHFVGIAIEEYRGSHRDLARYFGAIAFDEPSFEWNLDRPRALSELPYHLLKANDSESWEKLERTLTDTSYLSARLFSQVAQTDSSGRRAYDEIFALQADVALSAEAAPLDIVDRDALSAIAKGLARWSHVLRLTPDLMGQVAHNAIVSQGHLLRSHVVVETMRRRIDGPWLRLEALIGEDPIERSLHVGMGLRQVCISRDGSRIAVATDEALTVWDATTGRLLSRLATNASVLATALTADARYVAVGLSDGMVMLLDAQAARPILQKRVGTKVFAADIANDGRCFAAVGVTENGTGSGYLHVWNGIPPTDDWHANFEGTPRSLAIAPDSCFLLVGDERGLITIFDRGSRRAVATVRHHQASVKSIVFDRAGHRVASAAQDNTFLLWWPMPILGFREKLEGLLRGPVGIASKGAPPQAIVFLPDEQSVLTGDAGGLVSVRDARSGARIAEFTAHAGRLRSLSIAQDKPRLVSGARGDPLCHVWNTTAIARAARHGRTNRIFAGPERVGVLVAYESSNVHLYDYSGQKVLEIPNTMDVENFAFCDATSEVAMLDGQQRLAFWSLPESGHRVVAPRWFASGLRSLRFPRIAFSASGREVAVSAGDRVLVFTRGLLTTRRVHELPGQTMIGGLRWDNGAFTGLQAAPPTLRVWRFPVHSNASVIEHVRGAPEEPVRDFCFGPGDTIVYITYVSPYAHLDRGLSWVVEEEVRRRMGATGGSRISLLGRLDEQILSSMTLDRPLWRSTLSRSGAHLAISCEGDLVVHVLSVGVASAQVVQEIAHVPCDKQVSGLAFSPDGGTLVCGDSQGQLQFLRLELGMERTA